MKSVSKLVEHWTRSIRHLMNVIARWGYWRWLHELNNVITKIYVLKQLDSLENTFPIPMVDGCGAWEFVYVAKVLK